MRNAVAGIVADVEHQAVPTTPIGGTQLFLARYFCRGLEEVAQQLAMVGGKVVSVGDVVFGNYQHVCGRLRVEITKGQRGGGRNHDIGRDVSSDDLAE